MSSAGSFGRSPAGWFLCSAMGCTPRTKLSRCQEQQVLARGWGTAALPGSQALRQPPACPPHSITFCVRLLPPQAPADDERNRTSGMLFPKKRGKKVLQTARQCPETCFQLPTVACQRCGFPGLLCCRCRSSLRAALPTSLPSPSWVRDCLRLSQGQHMQGTAPPLLSPQLNRESAAPQSCRLRWRFAQVAEVPHHHPLSLHHAF